MVRKNGILTVKKRCRSGKEVKLPIFFSFRERREGELIKIGELSPPGVESALLKVREFVIKEPLTGLLIKAAVLGGKGELSVELLPEKRVENRAHNRFAFCPEEFGEFTLLKDGAPVGRAEIADISLSGLRLNVEGGGKIKPGEPLLVTQGTKVIELLPIRVLKEGSSITVGGRILNSNFCLIKFVIDKYIKVVGELLKTP